MEPYPVRQLPQSDEVQCDLMTFTLGMIAAGEYDSVPSIPPLVLVKDEAQSLWIIDIDGDEFWGRQAVCQAKIQRNLKLLGASEYVLMCSFDVVAERPGAPGVPKIFQSGGVQTAVRLDFGSALYATSMLVVVPAGQTTLNLSAGERRRIRPVEDPYFNFLSAAEIEHEPS